MLRDRKRISSFSLCLNYKINDPTREWTGGGELRFTCNAGYGIRVILLHEVARSFYATLQGGLSPLPEWGFRSMLFLSWQWNYPAS